MKYYLLSPKETKHVAVACAPESVPAAYVLEQQLNGLHALPFDLALKAVSFSRYGTVTSSDLSNLKQPWADYQPNSLAWPLFSQRLKNLLDLYNSHATTFDWLTVKVHKNQFDYRPYYVLRLRQTEDILALERCVFSGAKKDFLAIPAFSSQKLRSLFIFTIPSGDWQITSALYVNQQLKEATETSGMMGLSFEPISTF